ncbi:hypothetical protein M441DRAFT_63110 [Trichoderma asperellum CBS 433.97]|uniref:Uncharacterized protein n=1 Tax=Trichoderma asperellum (strain ATCC 204424 / CBS 433.97 / NBRC 101777) TaxID=1042311 RepID=A0A2T3YQZ2_TRIA4|nr:hypothetical protein M441DRAFT_63110 [Trichoderma asperellum CBS 433.97]PTB34939.1 hypothetical protein M441DRAFT_63110 [Trichoderma asperellum CBS 433.97]
MNTRRRRSRLNKNPARGMKNRQIGLGKKAHEYSVAYGSDVIIIIRGPDGHYNGYQSQPGLLRRLRSVSVPDDQLLGPDYFSSELQRKTSWSEGSTTDSTLPRPDSTSSTKPSLVPEAMDVVSDWGEFPLDDMQSICSLDDSLFHDINFTLNKEDFDNNTGSPKHNTMSTPTSPKKGELTQKNYSHLAQPKPISLSTRNTILSLLDSFFE